MRCLLPQYPANRQFPAAKATTVVHAGTNKNLLQNPDRIRESPPHYKPWDQRPVIKQYTDYLGNVSANTEVVSAVASNSTLLQSTTRTLRETPPTAPLLSGNFLQKIRKGIIIAPDISNYQTTPKKLEQDLLTALGNIKAGSMAMDFINQGDFEKQLYLLAKSKPLDTQKLLRSRSSWDTLTMDYRNLLQSTRGNPAPAAVEALVEKFKQTMAQINGRAVLERVDPSVLISKSRLLIAQPQALNEEVKASNEVGADASVLVTAREMRKMQTQTKSLNK